MSRIKLALLPVALISLAVGGSLCAEYGTSMRRNGTEKDNNCTIDFILKTCKPYKTFQSCHKGKCLCPTDLQSPMLKHNLSISTYWDVNHRQCVSKLNSVCFYLPPSFLVSQPYRCVFPNAECAQAPGQFRGVGICKCKDSHGETANGECRPSGQSSDNQVYIVGKKYYSADRIPDSIANSDGDIKDYDSNTSRSYYKIQAQCTWKFQCPHLQECYDGYCACPSDKTHKNGYWQNMVWDDDEKICVSLKGSYCNNARFKKTEDDMLIKTILTSMMEVRCAPGLSCDDSEGFEIGTCNKSNQVIGHYLIILTVVVLFLVNIYP